MATIVVPAGDFVGASVKRLEDGRFITGRGHFTDDIKLRVRLTRHGAQPTAHARMSEYR